MIKYIPFFLFPVFVSAQECPSISSLCDNYEIVEYVLVGRGDTTAVISRANLPKDLGLTNPKVTWNDDNGKFTMYYHHCLRMIYGELSDGRTGTTISRL